MEFEGGVAPRQLRDIRAGVASGRFLKAEPRLARAAVSGAVLHAAEIPNSSMTRLVINSSNSCCMLGAPFDAARELAHAPLPVAELP